MRTVLLGSDFAYTSNGDLVPIEINTNVGYDKYIIEDEPFNLSELSTFITNNNFIKIIYIGRIKKLSVRFRGLCTSLNIEYEFMQIPPNSVTIPDVEDKDNELIIRSAYDMSAIVDETYCKNKVNFLNLIKDSSFGTEFAYMDDNGDLISNISTIDDNGNHPNFILKSVYPKYDKDIYPKLLKVSTQEELDVILQDVNSNYFLMKYHINLGKNILNHNIIIRTFNILYPPDLISIPIGKYTRFASRNIDELSVFDPLTYELDDFHRGKYITSDLSISVPKILDDDLVEMADGTFKSGLELNVGDLVKTIDVSNTFDVTRLPIGEDSQVSYDAFVSGTTYTSNKVTMKRKIEKVTTLTTMIFTDGTTWTDTCKSAYLIVRNNNVMFMYLDNLTESIIVGDKVILSDTSSDEFKTELREISSLSTNVKMLSGWEITVEDRHIFLTVTSDNRSFGAIEHNASCQTSSTYTGINTVWWCTTTTSPACPKTSPYCVPYGSNIFSITCGCSPTEWTTTSQ